MKNIWNAVIDNKDCKRFLLSIFVVLCVSFINVRDAYALCATGTQTRDQLQELSRMMIEAFDQYTQEVAHFIRFDLEKTATEEVLQRFDEFNTNLYPNLTKMWNGDCTTVPGAPADCVNSDYFMLPAFQEMTRQLSAAKVAQTRAIGSFMDAVVMNERIREMRKVRADARKRYGVPEHSCQLDSVSKSFAHTRAYRVARAIAHTVTLQDTRRRNHYINPTGRPVVASAEGSKGIFVRKAHATRLIPPGGYAQDLQLRWREYVDHFCDNQTADQGCPDLPVPRNMMAGEHTNIADILWGDKQSFDLTLPNNRLRFEVALRTLISPFIDDPLPGNAAQTVSGREAMLRRRSRDARLNTVYNAIAQMVSERAGGLAGETVQDLRDAAGSVDTGTVDDSYSSRRDALSRARVMNPEYVVRLVNDPSSLTREQINTKAVLNQVTSDLYKRMEEMLMMEAAAYSHQLDVTKTSLEDIQIPPLTDVAALTPAPPPTPLPSEPTTGGYTPPPVPDYIDPGSATVNDTTMCGARNPTPVNFGPGNALGAGAFSNNTALSLEKAFARQQTMLPAGAPLNRRYAYTVGSYHHTNPGYPSPAWPVSNGAAYRFFEFSPYAPLSRISPGIPQAMIDMDVRAGRGPTLDVDCNHTIYQDPAYTCNACNRYKQNPDTYGVRKNPSPTHQTTFQMPSNYTVSCGAINMMIGFEGLVLGEYNDVSGWRTIGVGHLIKRNESFPGTFTFSDAMNLLFKDLTKWVVLVRNRVKVPITQQMFDTLVDFFHNFGNRGNNIITKLNQAHPVNNPQAYVDAANLMLSYRKTAYPRRGNKPKTNLGLTVRANDRRNLFINNIYPFGSQCNL